PAGADPGAALEGAAAAHAGCAALGVAAADPGAALPRGVPARRQLLTVDNRAWLEQLELPPHHRRRPRDDEAAHELRRCAVFQRGRPSHRSSTPSWRRTLRLSV